MHAPACLLCLTIQSHEPSPLKHAVQAASVAAQAELPVTPTLVVLHNTGMYVERSRQHIGTVVSSCQAGLTVACSTTFQMNRLIQLAVALEYKAGD